MKLPLFALVILSLTASTAAAQKKEATITVQEHAFLPVKVAWKQGDKTGEFVGQGTLPSGVETTLTIKPYHPGTFQWGNWILNDDLPTAKGGNLTMKYTFAPGDRLRIQPLQQVPLHSGATTRFKGSFVFVHVQLPKGIAPWAEKGTDALAKDLAKAVIKARKDKGHWGKFEGELPLSIQVPSGGDDVPEAILKATEEELTAVIKELLLVIRQQRGLTGDSIDQQIKKKSEL